MLDQLGLVHLNGRIYDPFTGAVPERGPGDPRPDHSQSYNRYTYVWNNPTNLTDPTGFDGMPVSTNWIPQIVEITGESIREGVSWARFAAQNPSSLLEPIVTGFAQRAFIVLIVVMPGNVGQKKH